MRAIRDEEEEFQPQHELSRTLRKVVSNSHTIIYQDNNAYTSTRKLIDRNEPKDKNIGIFGLKKLTKKDTN